jgi:hypothetical protein
MDFYCRFLTICKVQIPHSRIAYKLVFGISGSVRRITGPLFYAYTFHSERPVRQVTAKGS